MMRRAMRHPVRFVRDHRFTVRAASDYIDGTLPRDAEQRVHDHASVCPTCWRLLDTLRRTVGSLRDLPQPVSGDLEPRILDALRRDRGSTRT